MKTGAHRRHGFTIVELLIVIVVIGILAAIIIISYQGVQKKAFGSAMQTTLRSASVKMRTDSLATETYALSLPTGLKIPSGYGLALAEVSSTNQFCMNVSSSRYADLTWHMTQELILQTGLCDGAVVASSIIGDYSSTVSGPVTAAVTVNGDGGGLVVATDETWEEVNISWSPVSGASRYELQLRDTASSTWYLRRIADGSGNSNADIPGYSSDSSFSARIPSSSTSVTWHGVYPIPHAAGATFEYRIRSYDSGGVPSGWSTAALSVPNGTSLTKIATMTATAAVDWNTVNIAWTYPVNNVPSPAVEVQLHDSTDTNWYLHRTVESSAHSNAPITSPYDTDTQFSARIPVTTTALSWFAPYALPQSLGQSFEYRIRLVSTTITGLHSDWSTVQLNTPTADATSKPTGFSGVVAGVADASTVSFGWTAATKKMPQSLYEIQLRDVSTGTWYLRRILDGPTNGNADISSYQSDTAFSWNIPVTSNTLVWHGAYAVPEAGKTFEYRIRQRSAVITGLVSDWTVIQRSR